MGGQYYSGEKAWNFIEERTGIDLKKILDDLANNK
jgi:hypothetical protein